MKKSNHPLSYLSKHWTYVAHVLGLNTVAPFSVILPSGNQIDADVLLQNFGAPHGMLLATEYERFMRNKSEIVDAGFGFSVLSDPGQNGVLSFDRETILELLRDWGWSGPEGQRPAWLALSSVRVEDIDEDE